MPYPLIRDKAIVSQMGVRVPLGVISRIDRNMNKEEGVVLWENLMIHIKGI